MWPFRSSNDRSYSSDKLCGQLRRDLDQLRDDFDALRAQHLSLRGRVYALWGKEKGAGGDAAGASPTGAGSPSAPTRPRMTRDELRALAGLKPGQAYPHRDTTPTNPED